MEILLFISICFLSLLTFTKLIISFSSKQYNGEVVEFSNISNYKMINIVLFVFFYGTGVKYKIVKNYSNSYQAIFYC